MRKRRRIVIYGNSVIMGALRASLLRSRRYEVISLLPSQQDRLEAIAPDVVLFDLDAARPDAAFSLLESRQDVMLIGVRPDRSLGKVWLGRPLCELSTHDLMQLIDHTKDLPTHLLGRTRTRPPRLAELSSMNNRVGREKSETECTEEMPCNRK